MELKDETTDSIFPKGQDIDITHLYYIHYKCMNRENVRIYVPATLYIADDGHRVKDINGVEHFIPKEQFFYIKCQHKDEKRSRKILVEEE